MTPERLSKNSNTYQCLRQVEVLGPKCSQVNNVFGISQQTVVSQPARRGLGFHAQAMTRLTKPESSANSSLDMSIHPLAIWNYATEKGLRCILTR